MRSVRGDWRLTSLARSLGRALALTTLLLAAFVSVGPTAIASPPAAQLGATVDVPAGSNPSGTWTSGNTYVLQGDVTVLAGQTLTIQDGVIVRANGNFLFTVQGTLLAQGSTLGILFTNTTASPGAWQGLAFIGTSLAPITGSVLSHVTVEYGGYPNNGGNVYLQYAHISIDNSTFRNSSSAGIYAETGGVADISTSNFTNNGPGSALNAAVVFRDASVNPVLGTLTASGNGCDCVYTWGGTLSGDNTWEYTGLPYVFGGITVPAGAILTIQPGVEARFGLDGLNVNGRLTASGTAAAPIKLTSDSASPYPGIWVGVVIAGTSTAFNSGSRLDYVTVEYGSYPNSDGDLHLNYASATITHSTFRQSGEYGIATYNGSWVDVTDSTFTGNGLGAIIFGDASVQQHVANLNIANQHNGTSEAGNAIFIGGGTIATGIEWPALQTGVPYILVGGVNVYSGGTLTIDPGVEVRCQGQSTIYINDDGRLIADGTPTNPILVTGVAKTPGSWTGIVFSGTASKPNLNSRLMYTTVEYGGASGGNIYTEWAYPLIVNSTLRYSSADGIYGRVSTGPRVSYTAFTGNAGYAVRVRDFYYEPTFDHLMATGNGHNAIIIEFGTIPTDYRLTNAGLEYHFGDIGVASGAILTVEPGVTARFEAGRGLDVRGALIALGTAAQPIRFTGIAETPGSWAGLRFEASQDAPQPASVLDNVIIEYGNSQNIYTWWGKVQITRSTIRNAFAAGVFVSTGGGRVSIQNSQIVGNGGYGIDNGSPIGDEESIVYAPGNWWGTADGPAGGTAQCPASGAGTAIRGDIIFQPFSTSFAGTTTAISPATYYMLTLSPNRWFVPADGVLDSELTATLLDGAGNPVQGKIITATTSLGQVIAGGTTDVGGQARVRVSSAVAGDALVRADVDRPAGSCVQVASTPVTITFSPLAVAPDLLPNQPAPYDNAGLEVGPLPVVVGKALTVRATITNPMSQPILVNARLGIVQSSIGLAFPELQSWQDVRIEAHASYTFEALYIPLVADHHCIRFDYSWRTAAATGAVVQSSGSGSAQQNLSPQVQTGADAGCGGGSSSVAGVAGPVATPLPGCTMLDPKDVQKKREAEDARKKAEAEAKKQLRLNQSSDNKSTKPESDKSLWDDFWDWFGSTNATTGKGGGVKGVLPTQKRQATVAGVQSTAAVPRSDYTVIATATFPTPPTFSTADGLTAIQVAALNSAFTALSHVIGYGQAYNLSWERYLGAGQAGDSTWMARQAAADGYYMQKMGVAYGEAAIALQAFLDSYPNDYYVEVADIQATQQRLATQGVAPDDVAILRAAGMSDADIEALRQEVIAGDPVLMAGSARQKMQEAVEVCRMLSAAFNPPAPGPIPTGATLAVTTTSQLTTASDLVKTIEVGNPDPVVETIDLKVRRISMPAGWTVSLSPTSLTLNPGAHQTVTVRLSPPATAVQGTTVRFAIEGYVGTRLLSGVEFRIAIPFRVPFVQASVYLPFVSR